MRSLEIPKAAGVFTRHVCRCLALILMLLYPLSAAATDKVHLQLKWQHQFQFAGYYAAQAQGYYQAAGLEVEIIPCQPGEDPVQKVLQGKADFGVGSTELLLLRERGAPLVVLGVVFQHSPLVFMTLKRSGLQSIHDLVGRRVVIEPGSSELYAYLREEGIPLDKLTLLPHGFDTKDLLAGNVDALSAYVTDEPFELKQAGQEYVLYSPRVAGIDFYGDNLFTTESLLKLKPEMVRAFREASLKGWKYAMQHPEELVQLIYSRYSQRHSIEHLRFEAHQMVPLLQPVLVEIGHMNLGRWQHIAETYTKLGMLKPDFNFNGFLYDPNPPPPDLRWLYVLIGLVALAIAVVSAITVYVHRTNTRLRQEVDERKRAESQREALLEALEESEEHYRLLFEDAVDGMAVGNAETGELTNCNHALCRMVERDRTELIGQHQSILHPENHLENRISTSFRLHKAGDKVQVLEDRLVSKSGKIIPVEINATKIKIRGHEHLLGIFRDISERKQAEEKLNEAQALMQHVISSSPVITYTVTPDYAATWVTQNVESILGYTVAECLAPGWWADHLHPDDKDSIFSEMRGVLKSGRNIHEYRFQFKDGSYRWIQDTQRLLSDEQGNPTEIVGAWHDITDRKLAEEALRESTEKQKLERDRLDLILKTAQDGFWLVDASTGRLIDVNDAACSMLGYSREELLRIRLTDLDAQWLPEEIGQEMQKIKTVGNAFFETRQRTRSGQIIDVEVSVNYLPATDQFFLFIRDITERKQAKEALQKAKKEAEDANLAKTKFLASMSHEIRTPMNAIIGMADLLMDTSLTDIQKEDLEMLTISANNLMDIINDILDMSKIEAGHLELENTRFDLWDTVEAVGLSLGARAAQKGLEFLCHIDPEVPRYLIFDPTRLRQVLINLAGNSIKFTEQGEIVVRVQLAKRKGDDLLLHFSVRDTGIGIPKQKQEAVFESFTQAEASTTRKYGGTGLGLTISKQLVELMGGEIGIESEPGKGSTFYFDIPTTACEMPEETKEVAAIPELKGLKVLIVDDNATNRKILREILTTWGFVTKEAEDGMSALDELKKSSNEGSPCRLVLSDKSMPEMDGFELIEKIRKMEKYADIPILILSSDRGVDDMKRAQELGISEFLLKPVRRSRLYDSIAGALTGKDLGEAVKGRGVESALKGKALRILVAEDNLINQKLAVRILEKQGWDTGIANNGKEAVKFYEKGGFDLILMDVQMPEMDGIEATEKIRKIEVAMGGHIPIVALTANAFEEDKKRCLSAGMDAYTTKPIKIAELFGVIEEFLGGEN